VTAAVTADPEGDAISELARFWNGLTADEQTAVWPQLSAESKQLIERARERDADTHADSFFPEARDKQQIPDGDLWLILLIMAGRGFGKTRTGAEWIVEESIERVGQYAIVAPTFSAGRDICVEQYGDDGKPSGVLSVLERRGWTLVSSMPDTATRADRIYTWNRSMGELRLSTGSLIKVLSAERPDRIRGWNLSGAWADELGAWEYPDAYDQLRFALRVGAFPRLVITTTPRPKPMIREIVKRAEDGDTTVVVRRGATSENAANLSPAALAELENRYGGTRLGRQELDGELLDDVEGALWSLTSIHHRAEVPRLHQIAIGIDPSTWGEDTGASHKHVGQGIETGMVVAGITNEPKRRAWILEDLSARLSPDEWATVAVDAWRRWSRVAETFIVPETNAGGGMVTATIRLVDPRARIYKDPNTKRAGVHAAKGKRARAEPVAALYQQGRVFHVAEFDILEEQMTSWDSSENWSPDRIDALVWAITALRPWAAGPARASGPPSNARIGKPKPGARATGVSISQRRGPIGRPRTGR
jgi:phage terminase large subunit-like protein